MDTYFKEAFLFTMQHEGFYVDDPADPGGETYRGISRRHNPDWQGWRIIDKQKPLYRHGKIPRHTQIHDTELKRLVGELYLEKYWQKIKLHQICQLKGPRGNGHYPLLCKLLFDGYVQHGGLVIGWLQEACNLLGMDQLSYRPLVVDKAMGPRTLAAVAGFEPELLHDLVLEQRRAFLISWASRPGRQHFLTGLMNRMQAFPRLSA